MALARESDELADERGGALDDAIAVQRWRRGLRRWGGGGGRGGGAGRAVEAAVQLRRYGGHLRRRQREVSAVPFSQFIDIVMDIPVVRAALVSAVHTVQKAAETPQVTVQGITFVTSGENT